MTLRAVSHFAALALFACATPAAADPPPVKVCVTVAGDPDEAMRAGAESVTDAVAQHPALRGVADSDARAALRGDTAPADFADITASRRALRGADSDAVTLDALSLRLGCGLVVELMARPNGAAARVYDAVRHTWTPTRELSTLDAAVLTEVVLPALDARNATTGDAGVSAGDASVATTSGVSGDAGVSTGDASVAPHVDRRVTPSPASSPGLFSRAWPWLIVGGIAAAVVGVYFLSEDTTSTTTRVTVRYP